MCVLVLIVMQVAAQRMEHEMDTRHIADSATENFASPVHSLIASFVCHWARMLVLHASESNMSHQEAASILSLEDNLDEHGCQRLLPVLYELLQVPFSCGSLPEHWPRSLVSSMCTCRHVRTRIASSF
eukprot:Tamp_26502.p2 GENE.Tamp_26502~~Tamp_26502.p2  ORF type:complete len:128 (-),score=9.97 Tamp_26502:276-659(-)